jgi:16S rRNA G966 N2-methylase RsmD
MDDKKFDKKFVQNTNANDLDFSKLKAAHSSDYSSETPYHFNQLLKIIEPFFKGQNKKQRKILDMTGNVGGFTLQWINKFPNDSITVLEIDTDVYKLLKENIKILGFDKQIDAHNADSAVFIDKIKNNKYDFVYIDPPFGGPEYKLLASVQLRLGKKTMYQTIVDAPSDIVFVKVPRNFDFRSLHNLPYQVWQIKSPNPKKLVPDYLLIMVSK